MTKHDNLFCCLLYEPYLHKLGRSRSVIGKEKRVFACRNAYLCRGLYPCFGRRYRDSSEGIFILIRYSIRALSTAPCRKGKGRVAVKIKILVADKGLVTYLCDKSSRFVVIAVWKTVCENAV